LSYSSSCVTGLTNHDKIVFIGEQSGQTLAEQGVIVNQ
jgi:hypothetical protein